MNREIFEWGKKSGNEPGELEITTDGRQSTNWQFTSMAEIKIWIRDERLNRQETIVAEKKNELEPAINKNAYNWSVENR